MFIHRPEKNATEKDFLEGKVKKNVVEIRVEKHRSGSTGMFKLFFQGECTKFLNLDSETEEPLGLEEEETSISIKLEEVESSTSEENVNAEGGDSSNSADDDVFG